VVKRGRSYDRQQIRMSQTISPLNRVFLLVPALLGVALNAGGTILTKYPQGTNLENIAVGPNGDLYVTSVYDGTVYEVSPSGASQTFGSAPFPLTGAAFSAGGNLVVASGTSLYQFDSSGAASLVAAIPGAQSLNGLTAFRSGSVLVADDGAATVWKVNLVTGAAQPWLSGGLLDPNNPDLPIGPNGIKIFHDAVYITNTGAGTIVRVPILPDGSAGSPSVYASGLGLDDFAIGTDGSLFLATQVENSVVRLFPDGTQTIIGTADDGLLGDSSLAFGRTAADIQSIYVVNNGGAYENLLGGPGPGTIVRLDAGVTGVVPEAQAAPEPSTISLGVVALALLFRRSLRSKAKSH
jgi:hypothetical protein